MSSCEFLADASARIVIICTALGVSQDTARMIAAEWEQGVSTDWRGERPYIGARSGLKTSKRDSDILRDWHAGEHVPLIARRYGISRSRVWNILKTHGVSRDASVRALP